MIICSSPECQTTAGCKCTLAATRPETWAEEAWRLQQEIAHRQARLHYLVLGDQSKGVSGGLLDELSEDFWLALMMGLCIGFGFGIECGLFLVK